MLKKIKIVAVSIALVLLGVQGVAMAQGILPTAGTTVTDTEGATVTDCDSEINKFNNAGGFTDAVMDKSKVLGCAIMSGRISLAMVPYFIQYFGNYLLGLIGIIAVLFTVLGGFLYISGGMLPSQKDKGKKYIENALIGMGIAFLAWTIVNIILSAITG